MGSHHIGALRLHHLLAMRFVSMAYLRLIAVLLFGLVAVSANALVPKATQYYASNGGNTISTVGPWSTFSAACEGGRAWIAALTPSRAYRVTTSTDPTCLVESQVSSGGAWTATQIGVVRSANTCPVNSASSGSACACSSGYVEDSTHTACIVPLSQLEQFCKDAVAYKNAFPQHGSINVASPIPTLSCYKPDPPFPGVDAARGCAMSLGDGIAVPRDGVPTLRDWSATGVPTGATCEDAAASENAPKSTPDPCPNGFPGTLMGATVCVERQPDKGIEGVKGTQVKNADGTSTSIKETTKCEGGQCTTTTETTTKDANGAVVGAVKTEGRTEAIGEKCKADPGNKVCTATGTGDGPGGAGMTGSCAAGFVVKGDDPILNAMALEQYKRNCVFFENDTNAQGTVNQIRSGADTQNTDAMKAAASAAPVTIQTFDSTGRGWGRACPANPVIPLVFVSRSFEIPFSRICLPLQAFAMAGVALTMLGSFVWVMGGKK